MSYNRYKIGIKQVSTGYVRYRILDFTADELNKFLDDVKHSVDYKLVSYELIY